MSKYYELLQRASVEGNARPNPLPPYLRTARTYEMRPVPDAHVLSREELVKLIQTVFLLPGDNSPPSCRIHRRGIGGRLLVHLRGGCRGPGGKRG